MYTNKTCCVWRNTGTGTPGTQNNINTITCNTVVQAKLKMCSISRKGSHPTCTTPPALTLALGDQKHGGTPLAPTMSFFSPDAALDERAQLLPAHRKDSFNPSSPHDHPLHRADHFGSPSPQCTAIVKYSYKQTTKQNSFLDFINAKYISSVLWIRS